MTSAEGAGTTGQSLVKREISILATMVGVLALLGPLGIVLAFAESFAVWIVLVIQVVIAIAAFTLARHKGSNVLTTRVEKIV